MIRRSLAAVLLAPLLAAALAVPAQADPAPALPGVPALPAVPGIPSAGPDQEYVALGDSYSAGPLIEAQRPDPLGCLRSTNNYPAFLATYLHPSSYTDATCSGAETGDMWASQTMIVPTPIGGPAPAPQLDALSATTDLVTLGIGGNDYALFGSMIDNCEAAAAKDPDGAPCRDKYTVRGVDTKLRDARRIQRRVAKVVRAIHRRAPQADLYVVGYPRLLPRRGTCAAVPFAKGDYAWGRKVERRLNLSLRRAAENHGATYIDLYPASKGHDACAGNAAWINGSKIDPLRAADFHPFLKGMRGMSRAAYRQITGKKAPQLTFAAPLPALPVASPLQLHRLLGALER